MDAADVCISRRAGVRRRDADFAGEPGLGRDRTPPARRCAIRGRSSRPTPIPTASRTSSWRCATEVVRFRRPVAYVHGDSHYFRVDRPFQDALGRRLENFTRVETFGNNPANGTNDVQWLKVNVDARTREVFSYEAQIVPANRVAVPNP